MLKPGHNAMGALGQSGALCSGMVSLTVTSLGKQVCHHSLPSGLVLFFAKIYQEMLSVNLGNSLSCVFLSVPQDFPDFIKHFRSSPHSPFEVSMSNISFQLPLG